MRHMCVVGALFVVSGLVMLCCFFMMLGSVLVML